MSSLLVLDGDYETLGVLRSRAGSWGVTVEEDATSSGLQRLNQRGSDLAAVIVGAVPDPIRTAQRTHVAAPDVPILLLGSVEECRRMIQALRITPFVGRDVGCVARHPDDVFLDGVTHAIERGRRQRKLRHTIGALNRKLEEAPAPAPIEVGLLGRLVEIAPVGVVLTDEGGIVRAVNHLGTILLRQDERSMVGRTLLEAFPEAARRIVHDALDASDGSEPQTPSVICIEADRRTCLEITATVLDAATGGPGFLVLLTDITERVELVEQLQSAVRKKDEFLAMLGHELRNPLAPIRSALDLMNLRGDDPSTARERTVISRHVSHMVHLVDDLLDVSRITRGELSLERTSCDVAASVSEAVDMARPLIEQRRHHLEVHVPPGLYVHADTRRLTQVFTNLITNAAKYTDPGGRIRVTACRDGAEVCVTVLDTGNGIDPGVIATVFDPFVQGPQGIERATGGLGLGLAIVKSLVDLHDGRVLIRSEIGVGSELEVRIPAI